MGLFQVRVLNKTAAPDIGFLSVHRWYFTYVHTFMYLYKPNNTHVCNKTFHLLLLNGYMGE